MITTCPYCGKKLKVNDNLAGKRGTCPACKHIFIIPALEGPKEANIPPTVSSKSAAERKDVGKTVTQKTVPIPPGTPIDTASKRPPAMPPPIPQSALSIDISRYRHYREKFYFILAALFSVILWIIASPCLAFGIPLLIPVLLVMWMIQQSYKAQVFGNSIKVSQHQHKEIFDMANEISAKLGLRKVPHIFLFNNQGVVNARAVRHISSKYIILYSSLVDLMLSSGQTDQLKMILGHELAHHAAGHLSSWRLFLIRPAMILPHLGAAYSRACELTADRLGLAVTENIQAAKKSLVNLASGSKRLSSEVDLDAFAKQELEIPPLFGFINEIYSSHPRLTKRIIELDKYTDSPYTI